MATIVTQATLVQQQEWIPQNTTLRWTHQLTDDFGAPLTLTQLTTVTFTIYRLDQSPPVLAPGGWPRDIKNANGGAVSSSGLLTLVVSEADNAFLSASRSLEGRRWILEWTHASGTKRQRFQVDRMIARTLPVQAP